MTPTAAGGDQFLADITATLLDASGTRTPLTTTPLLGEGDLLTLGVPNDVNLFYPGVI